MILLNFSHPLTAEQLQQVEALTGQELEGVIDIPVQFDPDQPFLPQLDALMAQVPLTPAQYQTERIVLNLPALNFIAALLLAELHGRAGYFLPVLRLRPIPNSLPPQYEVAEVLNLQAVRDRSRSARFL